MSENPYPDSLAPLEPWLRDPEVFEIMVNGFEHIYLERSGRLVRVPTPFRDNDHVLEVMRAIVEPCGRRIDESSPMVDARLPSGARVNAVIPPIAVTGPALTIRKFGTTLITLEDMIRFGALSQEIVTFLRACVRGRLNIAVTGGTGSGKTAMLAGLMEMIPDGERIVFVQNADEMPGLSRKRLVKLESRPPNLEGKGEITIRDLVINSMNMRPDRIVIGEVRGFEALDVFRALNTGHDGSMFTAHATTPRDVLARLETLVLMANPSLPVLNIRQQMAAAIHLIVCLERLRDGSRKVVNVTEVLGIEGNVIVMQDIFALKELGAVEGEPQYGHTATGTVPKFYSRFRELGIDLPIDLFAPKE
jgi:pilus assembly protein CpaF